MDPIHVRRPEVFGANEAAKLLGVGRPRLHYLRINDPDFPQPLGNTGPVYIWCGVELRAYAAQRNTKPGHPAKNRAAAPTGSAPPGVYSHEPCWQPALVGIKRIPGFICMWPSETGAGPCGKLITQVEDGLDQHVLIIPGGRQ